MTTSVFEPTVAGVIVADLVSLIMVLVAVSGAVVGAVVLVTGWQWLLNRTVDRSGRGVQVPSEGVIGQVPGGAR